MATPNATNIWERAVALSLYVRRYNGRAAASAQSITTDADKSWLSLTKRLLDSPELEKVAGHDRWFKAWLTRKALPSFFRSGVYLVPSDLIGEIDAQIETYRVEREKLIDAFVAVYDEQVEAARERLGSLFDQENYVDLDRLRSFFYIKAHYFEFGQPRIFAKIKGGMFAREQERLDRYVSSAMDNITLLLRQNLLDLVQHASERLTAGEDGKRKRFSRSMVDGISEFLDTFSARNIADDTDLAAVVEQMKGLMTGVDADALRDNDTLRATVATSLSGVKDALSAMVESAPARAFSDTEE